MDGNHLEYPEEAVLTIMSVGHFSNFLSDGDAHEVICTYPKHLNEVQAIAVLIGAAAGREGVTFRSFIKRILASERVYFSAAEKRSKNCGGAPARDWEADYGRTPLYLELNAIVRRALSPGMTKAEARRSALQAARRGRPDTTYASDAEALKQLKTNRPGKSTRPK